MANSFCCFVIKRLILIGFINYVQILLDMNKVPRRKIFKSKHFTLFYAINANEFLNVQTNNTEKRVYERLFHISQEQQIISNFLISAHLICRKLETDVD